MYSNRSSLPHKRKQDELDDRTLYSSEMGVVTYRAQRELWKNFMSFKSEEQASSRPIPIPMSTCRMISLMLIFWDTGTIKRDLPLEFASCELDTSSFDRVCTATHVQLKSALRTTSDNMLSDSPYIEIMVQDPFNERLAKLCMSFSNLDASATTVLLVYNWALTEAAIRKACGASATAGWVVGLPSRDFSMRLRQPVAPAVYIIDLAAAVNSVKKDGTIATDVAYDRNLAHHASLLGISPTSTRNAVDMARTLIQMWQTLGEGDIIWSSKRKKNRGTVHEWEWRKPYTPVPLPKLPVAKTSNAPAPTVVANEVPLTSMKPKFKAAVAEDEDDEDDEEEYHPNAETPPAVAPPANNDDDDGDEEYHPNAVVPAPIEVKPRQREIIDFDSDDEDAEDEYYY